MLAVSNLSKSFGVKPVLKNINFTLKPGEIAGLIGPNGCGKTTLMRILAGEESQDLGSVNYTPADVRIGYLPQGLVIDPRATITSFISERTGYLPGLLQRLEVLADDIATGNAGESIQLEYNRLLDEIAAVPGSQADPEELLRRFGLAGLDRDMPVEHLSGGQKTRLSLLGVLAGSPQMLLLDEPTNHLDIAMLEWLEDWLINARCAALVISHDRAFLDAVTQIIFELNPETHSIKEYPGNFSAYLEFKEHELDTHWQRYTDQQGEIQALRSSADHLRRIARFRKGGKADGGDKFAKGFFGNRAKATIGRARHVENRLDKLLHEDHVDKPGQSWQMKVEFGSERTGGQIVLAMEKLSIGYSAGQALLGDIDLVLRSGDRVALIGPNGCGKTSLLRTLTGEISPLDGQYRYGSGIKYGYMAQSQDTLEADKNALEHILAGSGWNETDARTFLHRYLFSGDDVFTPAGSMSFGERARLMLALLSASGCNLLLLDEPVNHLDIPARTQFEKALRGYPGSVLAVTHDRYFIDEFASIIWQVENGKVSIFYG